MAYDSRSLTSEVSCEPAVRGQCAVCPAGRNCLLRSGTTQLSLPVAGKALFEAGAPVQSLYVVRAGCLKSFTVDSEGNERVRAFFLPGDFIGLDALGAQTHPASVVAVTAAQVCRVPMAQLRQRLGAVPALLRGLLERTSHDLAQALALAGDYTAEQRVAAFLLAMQQRLGARAASVHLPMTRRDIANYLRLATETVCRVLTRFEANGRIRSAHKEVVLLDGAALRALAAPAGDCGGAGLACAA